MISTVDAAASSGAWRWQTVGLCGPGELALARVEAINLIQWLARIANSYVNDETSEQRIELKFRASEAAFATREFDKNMALELRLPNLALQFLEGGKPVPHTLDPEQHSPAEIEAWILVELLHRGIDRQKFVKSLPYAIADLMSGDAQDHSPQSCRRGLEELTAWFRNATMILEAAARAAGLENTSIVCLPQTLALTCAAARGGNWSDIGFVPGDEKDPEPFFYLTRTTKVGGGDVRRAILKTSKLLAAADAAKTAMTFFTTPSI